MLEPVDQRCRPTDLQLARRWRDLRRVPSRAVRSVGDLSAPAALTGCLPGSDHPRESDSAAALGGPVQAGQSRPLRQRPFRRGLPPCRTDRARVDLPRSLSLSLSLTLLLGPLGSLRAAFLLEFLGHCIAGRARRRWRPCRGGRKGPSIYVAGRTL